MQLSRSQDDSDSQQESEVGGGGGKEMRRGSSIHDYLREGQRALLSTSDLPNIEYFDAMNSTPWEHTIFQNLTNSVAWHLVECRRRCFM